MRETEEQEAPERPANERGTRHHFSTAIGTSWWRCAHTWTALAGFIAANLCFTTPACKLFERFHLGLRPTRKHMEWGIIALGAAFVLYLLYCFIKEWRANRRFERIRRESREKAAANIEQTKVD